MWEIFVMAFLLFSQSEIIYKKNFFLEKNVGVSEFSLGNFLSLPTILLFLGTLISSVTSFPLSVSQQFSNIYIYISGSALLRSLNPCIWQPAQHHLKFSKHLKITMLRALLMRCPLTPFISMNDAITHLSIQARNLGSSWTSPLSLLPTSNNPQVTSGDYEFPKAGLLLLTLVLQSPTKCPDIL